MKYYIVGGGLGMWRGWGGPSGFRDFGITEPNTSNGRKCVFNTDWNVTEKHPDTDCIVIVCIAANKKYSSSCFALLFGFGGFSLYPVFPLMTAS